MLTVEQLDLIVPGNEYIDIWHKTLTQLLPDYNIDTPQRIAGFLAQCSHESAGFTTLVENLNYRWQTLRKVFPKYFPTDALAQEYARGPNRAERIANRVYANRMGNGPESSGDGYLYRGRGLIQLTGKDNYFWFAASLEITPEDAAAYMETFEGAAQSACWFWETNDLNKYADNEDLLGMTKRINGGVNGLEDRKKHYYHALEVLGE